MTRARRHVHAVSILAGLLAFTGACGAQAGGSANGTLTYKSKGAVMTMTPKFAYLVTGPGPIDSSKPIRHLILSATDLEAKLAACKTMSCTDADLGHGMTVDLDGGPRVSYWVVLDGQRVQYSGTATTSALALTADTPSRVAGKLSVDDSAAGGPQFDIDFDAPLTKEMKQAR